MLAAIFGPFLLGLVLALASGRVLIPILRKLKAGQTISSDAPQRHQTKAGTPTMGGAIIVLGGLLGGLLYPAPSGDRLRLLAVLACTLGFGLIGFIDDLLIVRRGKNLGLRAREKLLGQVLVAGLFEAWYWWGDPARLGTGEAWIPPVVGAIVVFHLLLLVGFSNAVNLTDGLDALAGTVTVPIWLALGLGGAFWTAAGVAGIGGVSDYGVVAVCGAFAGATVGYLWYNAHPAQVFMGDTGSLAVGGGLAAAAIALRLEWLLLVAAAVPVVEAASVTLQVVSFKTRGKRIFKMAPLHHHFELCEWPETRVVGRFAIASALACALALTLFFSRA